MQTTFASWVSPPSPNPSHLKARLSASPPISSPLPTPNFIHPQIFSQFYYTDEVMDCSTQLKFSLPSHVKFISSTANPFVKHCVKLHKSSHYRHAHSSVLVVGTTPIREIYRFQELMEGRSVETECLIILDKARVPEELDNPCTRTLRASALVMKRLSQLQSTESIEAIALMKFPTSYFVVGHEQDADCRKWFPAPRRILVLEGIQGDHVRANVNCTLAENQIDSVDGVVTQLREQKLPSVGVTAPAIQWTTAESSEAGLADRINT